MCLVLLLATIAPVRAAGQESPFPESEQPSTAARLTDALHRIEQLENQLRTLTSQPHAVPPETSTDTSIGNVVWQTNWTVPTDGTATTASGFHVDFDRGFAILPNDKRANPFDMRINSWFQLRHTYFDSQRNNPDQNDFEFERLRLIFSGHAFTNDLKYFLQLDGDDDAGTGVTAFDYYLSYDTGHHDLGLQLGRLGIRAGRWKSPFNRSRSESGLKLQFADRSVAGVFFDINRSVGVSLFGEADLDGIPLGWELAVLNGLKTAGFKSSRSGELDNNLGVSGRLHADVMGDWGNDGEPDLSWHERPALRLGAGFAYAPVNRVGQREFEAQRVVDSGQSLAGILPADTYEFDVAFFTVDAQFKYQGFSVIADVFWRQISDFEGAVIPDLQDQGLLLQVGYFVVPKKLEILSRWSRIVGDSGTLGGDDASADEVAGGLAWYIRGQSLKLVFDATHVNGVPISDRALNIRPGDDGWLFRTQFQFWF